MNADSTQRTLFSMWKNGNTVGVNGGVDKVEEKDGETSIILMDEETGEKNNDHS